MVNNAQQPKPKGKLDKNAFDWIEAPAIKAELAPTASEPAAAPSESRPLPVTGKQPRQIMAKGNAQHNVFIRFKKEDGAIVGMIEFTQGETTPQTHPYLNVPDSERVEMFTLTGELEKIDLINIHNGYKIDASQKKLRLIPKG